MGVFSISVIVGLTMLIGTGCERPEAEDPVQANPPTPLVAAPTAPSAPPAPIAPTPPESPAPAAELPPLATSESKPQPPVSAACLPISAFPGDEPVYLPKAKVVLTRISAPCTTPAGQPGHLPTAGWMAMGFPCTGGEGRIDWKGTNYNAPKMVSFLLNTSCPMAPHDTNKLKSMVTEEAGLAPTLSMVAFNPFVVQFWEVTDHSDADATFTVDLRNKSSLTTGWTSFIKQKPFKVFLVGRENAWVPGNHMYAVEAEIQWVSKNRFMLNVITARVLKGDELAKVKARCEALTPERECGKVF